MKTNNTWILALSVVLLAIPNNKVIAEDQAVDSKLPNIVLILADDMQ